MKNRVKGSAAVEAVMSLSVFIIVMLTLFGTLISIYLDEEIGWSMLETSDELSLIAMPLMGHELFIQKETDTFALSNIAKMILLAKIEKRGFQGLIEVSEPISIKYDAYGSLRLSVKYQYNLPSLDVNKILILPLSAAVFSDGIDFSTEQVYITTYGEKYHKSECFHLRKSKFGVSYTFAIENGYEACRNCYKNVNQKN